MCLRSIQYILVQYVLDTSMCAKIVHEQKWNIHAFYQQTLDC